MKDILKYWQILVALLAMGGMFAVTSANVNDLKVQAMPRAEIEKCFDIRDARIDGMKEDLADIKSSLKEIEKYLRRAL